MYFYLHIHGYRYVVEWLCSVRIGNNSLVMVEMVPTNAM